MNDFNDINAPFNYAETAVLARDVGEELLSRLDWMTIQPAVIVNIGCGTGEMSALLKRRYPNATVIALDVSLPMVTYTQNQKDSGVPLCADAEQLPFPLHSVDLIFANFLLPWHPQFNLLLREWHKIIRPNGLLLFSALGPGTLPGVEISPVLVDMHDIGDCLLHEKFSDPVLDVCNYTLVYREEAKLLKELIGSGMLLQHVLCPANTEGGTWSLNFEVIFGHAFTPEATETVSASEDGIVRIPLSHLKKQLPAS